MPTETTRTRAPRRDAAENREALMLAAATLLNRDPAASLEAIAAEAGLSRRAIYGHFATRDDLLRELALRGAARINGAMLAASATKTRAAAVPTGVPATSRAGANATDSLDPATPDPAFELATFGARLWSEVDHVRTTALLTVRGPQMSLVGDALAPIRSHVRGIVERGIDAGDFRADMNPGTLSHLIESAAISVLDESTRTDISTAEGRRLVVLSVLGIAGFGHADATLILNRLPKEREH